MAIPKKIKQLAHDVRNKIYGRDVRESIAKSMEETGNIADESNVRSISTEVRQTHVEARYDVAVGEMTEESELLDVRVGADGNVYPNVKKRLDEEHNGVVQHLDTIDETLANNLGWTSVKDFGAMSDTDDMQDAAPGFNAAVSSVGNGDPIFVPSGTYHVHTPTIIDKKISFYSDGQVKIVAQSEMDAVITMKDQTIYTLTTLKGLEIDGNLKADYCLEIDGGRQGGEDHYAAVIKISELKTTRAVFDGIKINAPAWNIKLESVMSLNNGRDGINAFSTSAATEGQINAVTLDDCTIIRNGRAGLNYSGTKHAIRNSTIEQNDYGILVDVKGLTYSLWASTISESYIEHNRVRQIKIVSNAELEMKVENSLINGSMNGLNDVLISVEGGVGSVTLILENNTYNPGGGGILDGGNALNYRSKITGISKQNKDKFKNLGRTKVEWHDLKTTVVPISTSQGLHAESLTKSVNILDQSPRRGRFIVSQDMTSKLIDRLNFYVETDCNSAIVTTVIYEYDLSTGSLIRQTLFNNNITSNGLISNNLVNNWGHTRLSPNSMLAFDIQVNDWSDGDYVKLHNPYITYV